MAFIGWIIATIAFLCGLTLRQDVSPLAGYALQAELISRGLFALAFLSCPVIWREKPMGIGRKPRIMLSLAMLLALPLVLMPLA